MKNRQQVEPKMLTGRKGEVNEYVEFRVGRHNIRFVAQKSSTFGWYVYEVHPGSNGKVATLGSFSPTEKDEAVEFARLKAKEMFWG